MYFPVQLCWLGDRKGIQFVKKTVLQLSRRCTCGRHTPKEEWDLLYTDLSVHMLEKDVILKYSAAELFDVLLPCVINAICLN